MAGLINWKKVSLPASSPDSDHVYVGVDSADGLLYLKNSAGTVIKYPTSADVSAMIAAVIDSAPGTLDTLNELAAALGDDPNFATTITNLIAGVQADIDAHEANTSNPHSTTAAQVGAYTTTQTDTQISNAVSTHTAALDPHPQYQTASESQAQVDAHANLTNNPHSVTKAQVGLSNADNTSDANKPISNATQTALNLKADKATTISAGTGLSGGGDLSSNRTLSIALDNTTVSATATTTTTSATDVLMNAMTITPAAGTYLVFFGTSLESSANDADVFISIYSGGSQVSGSERGSVPNVSASFGDPAGSRDAVQTHAIVTVNGSQAIEGRWRRSSGTASAFSRNMSIIRIG